jgi:hypothetical protein
MAMGRIIILAAVGSLLASCQTMPRGADKEEIETHEAMVHWLNPALIAIFDVTDKAKSEAEGLDPVLMDEVAWTTIQRAAQSLEFSARRMAEAQIIRVGDHTAEQVGFANRAEIQARIDADPKWFRELSRQMAADAHDLTIAVTKRDLRRTSDLTQGLNASCQTCHTRYWEKN